LDLLFDRFLDLLLDLLFDLFLARRFFEVREVLRDDFLLDFRLERLLDLRLGAFGVLDRRLERLRDTERDAERLTLLLEAFGVLLRLALRRRRDFDFLSPEPRLLGALGVRARRLEDFRDFDRLALLLDALGVRLRRLDLRRDELRLLLFFGALGVRERRFELLREADLLLDADLLFDADLLLDALGVLLRLFFEDLRLADRDVLRLPLLFFLGAFGVRARRLLLFRDELRFLDLGVRLLRLDFGREAFFDFFFELTFDSTSDTSLRATLRLGALGVLARRLELRRDTDLDTDLDSDLLELLFEALGVRLLRLALRRLDDFLDRLGAFGVLLRLAFFLDGDLAILEVERARFFSPMSLFLFSSMSAL